MNPRNGATPTVGTDPDEERLAGLIRSVADDWRMPPQRLGKSTWRERTGEVPAVGGVASDGSSVRCRGAGRNGRPGRRCRLADVAA